jgi:hypothetical protein
MIFRGHGSSVRKCKPPCSPDENGFYPTNRALGLCLYNLGTMPPAALDDCLATHRYVRVDGPILLSNPFYELPENAMRRVAQPQDVPRKVRQIRAERSSE